MDTPRAATLDDLLALPVLPLRLRLRFTRAGELPPFKGSTLRGALGRALRGIVCERPSRAACEGCPLLGRCSFPFLFEGLHRANPWLAGARTPPPFVLAVPDGSTTRVRTGDELTVDLTLVGEATAYAALFLRAVDEAGDHRGLGGARGDGAGRFERLETQVRPDGPGLGGAHRLPESVPAAPLEALLPPEPAGTLRRLLLLSPLQLKVDGRQWVDPASPPPPERFIAAARRRLYLLNWAARRDFVLAPPADQPPAGRWVDAELRLRCLERWSDRHGARKPLDGLEGWLLVDRAGAEADALLGACRWLGLGRQTTMGLGRIDWIEA
jgi:hypothetical protein